jgi:hypothetical protein
MNPASAPKPGTRRILLALAAAGAAVLTLTASDCQTKTAFEEFVPEICTDNTDNDGDRLIDCKDSDCSGECKVTVNIDDFSKPIKADSLLLTGTQTNASTVVVNIAPQGVGGTATLETGIWKRTLTGMSKDTTYTLTVIAANGDFKDTAITTFERKQ